jgi:hypothetical protein
MKRSDILGVVVEVFDVCGSEKEVDRPKHSPRQPPDIEGGWTRKFATLPLPIGPSDKRHINELGDEALAVWPPHPEVGVWDRIAREQLVHRADLVAGGLNLL